MVSSINCQRVPLACSVFPSLDPRYHQYDKLREKPMENRAWGDLADRNPLVGFIDINLRGARQVFFQKNSLTGFIILAAIFWAGCSCGSVSVACGAVLGLTVVSLTAIL